MFCVMLSFIRFYLSLNALYIDGQLYICDMENKRIVTFNPDNGKITPYILLDSKPFAFLKWKNQFVIQSDTGIYLLEGAN